MKDGKEGAQVDRPHALNIDQRKRAVVSGVEAVDSFNEQAVVLDTTAGALTFIGEALHVSRLNLEEGQLVIDGHITALEYDERARGGRGSGFGRLFR